MRNAARLGGNILQRTRCPYFRDTAYAQCNKRAPGSGCAALEGGETDMHAILGGSEACVAMYPGDFAQALIAFDAEVATEGPGGTRTIPFADLHVLPGDTPEIETMLEPGEIVTRIDGAGHPRAEGQPLPQGPRPRKLCVRQRLGGGRRLEMDGDTVRDVRIALGGVASVPWRAQRGRRER